MKRILILTADTGLGHRSAANAVASALQEQYGAECSVSIVNPMDHPAASPLLRNVQADYDRMVREMPDLYRLGYQTLSGPLPNALIESAFTVMLFEALRDILRQAQPDAIVDTYESYLAPLDAIFTIRGQRIPLVTTVTDLATLHPAWFNDTTDLCMVPTQIAYDLGVSYGLPPSKLKITGLPVNPRFASEKRDKAAIRAELGWRSDLITVLAVGSPRVNNVPEMLNVLNHSGLPLQLVIVCGGNDSLYQHVMETEWHSDVQRYNFVDNMPTLMHAADCVMGKAGGLFVSEALASGLPILLIDMIQGQETGNTDFVVNSGAGEYAHDPVQALEIMFHWMDKGAVLLAERAQKARAVGHPRAAYEVADLVLQAAQHKTAPKHKRVTNLRSLTELLTNFNIPWKEESPANAVDADE
ncbi:MAG TPA: glycosyltransferase [Aggregatilineales bacterium]|nr:glycosyltransferase [Aggregatilineales bacterium]